MPKIILVDKAKDKNSSATKKKKVNPIENVNPQIVRWDRDAFGDMFLKDFIEVWAEKGKDAIKELSLYNPAAFVRLGVAILPKETPKQEPSKSKNEEFADKLRDEYGTKRQLDEYFKSITDG